MITDPFDLIHLPDNLRIPVGARGVDAIRDHVGVVDVRARRAGVPWTLVVRLHEPIPRPDGSEIWRTPRALELWRPVQVWAHVDQLRFDDSLRELVGADPARGEIVDPLLDRELACLAGFSHVRLCGIDAGNATRRRRQPLPANDRLYRWNKTAPIAWAGEHELRKLLDRPRRRNEPERGVLELYRARS